MNLYRKRPVEVYAVRWTGENLDEVTELTEGSKHVAKDPGSSFLYVQTPDGKRRCPIGDYVTRNGPDAFYAYAPEVFEEMYERVLEVA